MFSNLATEKHKKTPVFLAKKQIKKQVAVLHIKSMKKNGNLSLFPVKYFYLPAPVGNGACFFHTGLFKLFKNFQDFFSRKFFIDTGSVPTP